MSPKRTTKEPKLPPTSTPALIGTLVRCPNCKSAHVGGRVVAAGVVLEEKLPRGSFCCHACGAVWREAERLKKQGRPS